MKKKILLLFLLLFANVGFSQSNVSGKFYSDETVLKVEYAELSTFLPGLVNENIGNLYVVDDFLFYKTIFNDKKFDANEISIRDENSIVIKNNSSKKLYELYLDRNKNEIKEYIYEEFAFNENFEISELTPKMEWEFLNDEMQIGDYNCLKARTTFRGRTYEVWYTEEIPVPYGPWKLNGLPGLILVANDLDSIYEWRVKSVTKLEKIDIDIHKILNEKKSFKKLTYRQFDAEVVKKRIENYEVELLRTNDDNLEFSFDTMHYREPSNEFRSQTHFIIN